MNRALFSLFAFILSTLPELHAQRIAGGTFETAGICAGYSSVWDWGSAFPGDLAEQVDGLATLTAIDCAMTYAAQRPHKLALKSDGTVWAWGGNTYGQLGNGTTADSSAPAIVAGLHDIKAISAGNGCSMALQNNGTLLVWGDNTFNVYNDGNAAASATPVVVPWSQALFNNTITAVALAERAVIVLLSDSTVWTWGTYSGSLTPYQVTGINGITKIAAGSYHYLALKNDGTVWAWGDGSNNALGNGSEQGSSTALQVSGLDHIISISAGRSHNAVLRNDGTVWTWGDNHFGQSGTGVSSTSTTPMQVAGLSGVSEVDCGDYSTIVLKSNNEVWSFGDNSRGQLGINSCYCGVDPCCGFKTPAKAERGCTYTGLVSASQQGKAVSIAPNPGKGRFVLTTEAGSMSAVTIYNAVGDAVHSVSARNKSVQLNLDEAPVGIYFCHVQFSDGSVTVRKLILEN